MARNLIAGLVAAIMPLANCFTFAALIFSGPLLPLLSQGVAIMLITAAVTSTVVALTSGFRIALAGPISLTSALLATLLVRLAPTLEGQSAAAVSATVLATLMIATLATGTLLLALGGLRLGRIVRFMPYPVIAGFIGASGWVMATAALRMVTDIPVAFASWPRLAEPRADALLAGLVAVACVLLLARRRWRSSLTIPLILVAVTLAFDIGLGLFGASLAQARAAGLLFDVGRPAPPSLPLLSGALGLTDWGAILRVAPGFVPVIIVGMVQVLVTAAGLELALDDEADLDRELRSQGLANLASGLAGGIVGFVSTSYTISNQAAHANGRLSALLVGILMLAGLVGGAEILSVIPRIALGGMLLMLATDLMWTWGVAIRHQVPLHEWLLTIAIIVLTAVFGFLPALLVGLIGSCVLFAVSLSRFGIVRHSYGIDEASSVQQRSEAELRVLAERGGLARVIELGGFLFFGSSDQLLRQLKVLLQSAGLQVLVLDFSGVIGIDSSAGWVLGRARSLVGRSGAKLIVSGLRAHAASLLDEASVVVCATLDEALELAENIILAEGRMPPPDAPAEIWMEAALGDPAIAHAVCQRLEFTDYAPGFVLCRQGDAADTMYFVASGRISVTVAAAHGGTIRVSVFGPQTVAGEIGFLLNEPRTASLQVEQPATIGHLSRTGLAALSASDPSAATALLAYLARQQAERLSIATRQIVALRR